MPPPRRLLLAERPLIYAGQGVHYAKAWPELKRLAELSGSAGDDEPRRQERVSGEPSAVFGIGRRGDAAAGVPPCAGCGRGVRRRARASRRRRSGFSFRSSTRCSSTTPSIPMDINKNIPAEHALLGDSKLALKMLGDAIHDRLNGRPRGRQPRGRRADRAAARGMAQGLDAAADQRRHALVALSRDRGADARRRYREHHHHP